MILTPEQGMNVRRFAVMVGLALLAYGVPGCILGNRPTLFQVGSREDQKTYFLDGAGNYGFGKETVPLGLADGGYQGHVEHFIWTTYLGAVVDQISVGHNRREGRNLAGRIQEFLDTHSDGEVNLIGLSAGTGVVVFALESLEPKYHVQNVVMLSSSLSADYDLTGALRHVDGGIYFFWSPDDPILGGVVPIIGTVDRSPHRTSPAGTWGARLPFGAGKQSRQLYGDKVHNVRWYPEPLIGPFKLRHAGSISRPVIRDLVAPILVYRSRPARGPETQPAPKVHAPTPPPGAPTTRPKLHAVAPTRHPPAPPRQQRPVTTSPSPSVRQPALITAGGPTTAPAKASATTRPAARLAP